MTAAEPKLLRVTYATATADAVAAFVAAHYDMPEPLECLLLRRGFNDSFAVLTPDQTRFVLRMSGRRKRGDADVDTETRFLAYLDRPACRFRPLYPIAPARCSAKRRCRKVRDPSCCFDTPKDAHQISTRRRMRERRV